MDVIFDQVAIERQYVGLLETMPQEYKEYMRDFPYYNGGLRDKLNSTQKMWILLDLSTKIGRFEQFAKTMYDRRGMWSCIDNVIFVYQHELWDEDAPKWVLKLIKNENMINSGLCNN